MMYKCYEFKNKHHNKQNVNSSRLKWDSQNMYELQNLFDKLREKCQPLDGPVTDFSWRLGHDPDQVQHWPDMWPGDQGPGLDKCVQCEEISVETDITQYIGFITKYG